MYKIIGADQKEYGPVSADQLRQWITERRINAQTQAQAEGTTGWKPLGEFSEFADALGATKSSPSFAAATPVEDIFDRDYDLDIGGCIGRGWELLKNNFSLLFCGSLIYFAIEFAIGLLGAIPFVGPLFSILNLVIVGPIMGGLFYLTLQAIRQKPASPGDVFAGFRMAFLQLFLGTIVCGLLAGLCFVPAGIVAAIMIFPSLLHHHSPEVPQLIIVSIVALACIIPAIFLGVNWKFTLPLIIDRRMDFWPAMQTSWKMVRKHWWQVFGLIILIGLLNVVGVLLCCVGLLFTMPVGIGALMYAYETIFSASASQSD